MGSLVPLMNADDILHPLKNFTYMLIKGWSCTFNGLSFDMNLLFSKVMQRHLNPVFQGSALLHVISYCYNKNHLKACWISNISSPKLKFSVNRLSAYTLFPTESRKIKFTFCGSFEALPVWCFQLKTCLNRRDVL